MIFYEISYSEYFPSPIHKAIILILFLSIQAFQSDTSKIFNLYAPKSVTLFGILMFIFVDDKVHKSSNELDRRLVRCILDDDK